MDNYSDQGPESGLETKLDDYNYFQFLGQKVAGEVLEEFGMVDSMDEKTIIDLRELLGRAGETGIILASRNRTSAEDIELATAIVNTSLVTRDRYVAAPYMPILIQRGIDFHDELVNVTPRALDWSNEYNLLNSFS